MMLPKKDSYNAINKGVFTLEDQTLMLIHELSGAHNDSASILAKSIRDLTNGSTSANDETFDL